MKTDDFDNITAIVVRLNRMTGVKMFAHSNTWFWLLLNCLYKAILMLCFLVFAYADYLLEHSLTFNYLGPILYIIMSILGFLSIFTVQILGWRYNKEMSLLRKIIAETDQSLIELNAVVDHRHIYIWIVAICAASALSGILSCIFYVYTGYTLYENRIYILSDILHDIILYIGGMVVLDFMSHVCWLERSFKQTNDLLKKFFIEYCPIEMEDWNNKMVASWLQRCLNEWRIGHFFYPNKLTSFEGIRIMERSTLHKINILQQIRYIHLQLCVITKLLNKIFDTQILFHSILTVQSIVAISFYVYTETFVIQSSEHYSSLNIFNYYTIDVIYVWLKVVVTCYLCEKAAKELIQFYLQVFITEVDLKNTHLFRLNDSFILQSMGSIFTYFIITVQWSQAFSASGSSYNLTTFN